MIFDKTEEDTFESDDDDDDEIDVDISFKYFDGEVKVPDEERKKKKRVACVMIHVTNAEDVDSLVKKLKELNENVVMTTLPSFDF